MGTRGLYGLRKNGVDKLTYNHFDSYPDCLGREVIRFCIATDAQERSRIFDCIEMVNETNTPTEEQVRFCKDNGLVDTSVSTGSENDWYCLLREIQGDMGALRTLVKRNNRAYMIDNKTFILDSLFCEYAYIVNLDTQMLEFYVGFQKSPEPSNRYGHGRNGDYYPCKMVLELPLNEIKHEDDIVRQMEEACV